MEALVQILLIVQAAALILLGLSQIALSKRVGTLESDARARERRQLEKWDRDDLEILTRDAEAMRAQGQLELAERIDKMAEPIKARIAKQKATGVLDGGS